MKGLLNLLAPTALKAISTANPIAGMATNLIAKKLNIPVSSTVEEIETHLEQHPEKHEELKSLFKKIDKNVHLISAHSRIGLNELNKLILENIAE